MIQSSTFWPKNEKSKIEILKFWTHCRSYKEIATIDIVSVDIVVEVDVDIDFDSDVGVRVDHDVDVEVDVDEDVNGEVEVEERRRRRRRCRLRVAQGSRCVNPPGALNPCNACRPSTSTSRNAFAKVFDVFAKFFEFSVSFSRFLDVFGPIRIRSHLFGKKKQFRRTKFREMLLTCSQSL